MRIGYRSVGVVLVVLGVALAVTYEARRKHADKRAAPAPLTSMLSSPSSAQKAAASESRLPPDHPPLPGTSPAATEAAVEREGKVDVPRDANFVHFRVGNRNVKAIYRNGGVLWVGTSGGVIRYDTRDDKFRLFDNHSGLLSNGIFHVSRIGDTIVAGTYGGGMSLYDEGADQWNTLNIPDGLADAFVYDVLELKNHDVWIATWSGANLVRGGALKDKSKWETFTVENTKGGLPNDWVYGLAEGKDGEVWLATEGGLARFKDNRWDNWNHEKGLGADYERVKNDLQFKEDPAQYSVHHARQKEEMHLQGVNTAYNPNYVVSLAVDRDGVAWAGTWGGGLSRFDGATWKVYTVQDGLPGNHVFLLRHDSTGKLWIGTNNGLAYRNGDKFEVLNTNDGLFSNTVFSLASGDDGSLWVGGYGGVAHLLHPR
jgi:ligand-binding sensor domain-containing protein